MNSCVHKRKKKNITDNKIRLFLDQIQGHWWKMSLSRNKLLLELKQFKNKILLFGHQKSLVVMSCSLDQLLMNKIWKVHRPEIKKSHKNIVKCLIVWTMKLTSNIEIRIDTVMQVKMKLTELSTKMPWPKKIIKKQSKKLIGISLGKYLMT